MPGPEFGNSPRKEAVIKNLLSGTESERRSRFIIVWTDLGEWEWVDTYHESEAGGGPHGYAFCHKNYKKSKYFFMYCEKPPEIYNQTPEDDLLDKIFIKD